MDGYGTDAEFNAYVASMGVTLPPGVNVAAARLRASVWLDSKYESRFPGTRTDGFTQDRAWPRTGAQTRSGVPIPPDVVPLAVVYASYEAAIREAKLPGSLSPDYVAGQVIKRKKVGPLEKEFAVSGTIADVTPVIGVIDGMLTDYLLYDCMPAVVVV